MLAIGLMSGTSLDGIDAAVIESDGETISRRLGGITVSYDVDFRARLRDCLGHMEPTPSIAMVDAELTDLHAAAVTELLTALGLTSADIGLIGFHGHTLTHDPEHCFTWQLGDGGRLAAATGVNVVCDFRSADVAAGGQGAPLAPAYHRALAEAVEKPIAVLNLGGVANATWIGVGGEMLAFDTGPANALLDDWINDRTGKPFDEDGATAASGTVDKALLTQWLGNPYFERPPPKSLDRDAFDISTAAGLSTEDGAATLAAFTLESIAAAARHFPAPPTRWLVTGGGRRNTYLMNALAERFGLPVDPVEQLGWNGDLLEAEAFAYLAIRSAAGLPISWLGTTGVAQPLTGGRTFRAQP